MNGAVHDLQIVFEVGPLGGLSDALLVERFAERREEAVFEAIVRRHGPMVWGVCRRVLRDHHDAEEAFQTTFVVLARKAASLMTREKLGNWLYGVAYQTAMKARANRARRRGREVQVPDMPEPPEAESRRDRDGLSESLDRELSRLPEKFRAPIVLCELEGRSHKEAAGQLGWPIGTVSSRLSRARAMLARRLGRRGVALSAGGLAAMLTQESAAAGMPAGLVGPTVRAASLLAAAGATAGAGAVPAGVAALTREVLKAMLLSKIKTAVVALLAGVVVIAGGFGLAAWAQTTGSATRGKARPGPSNEPKGQPKAAATAKANASTRTPRVASVSPDDGEGNVDPLTSELRVTFEQDMDTTGYSFVGGGPSFPKAEGTQPRWLDARTIVLPMKLAPNREYELSLNNQRFQNFMNTKGQPAVPYPIRFRTGDGQSKPITKAERPPRTPRVASASPDDGAMDVDPATRELRVTFEQDMDQSGFSITGGGPTFPGEPGTRPRWVDARTIVMPLKMQPNREYELSINSASFQNFKNTEGRPAVPYPIRFRTGKGTGAVAKAATGPPRVASASPDNGAMNIDPATRELRVTFDQDMDRGGFSITGGGPTFPGAPGTRPRWVDARTIVMPLKMEPNREYELSINSTRFQNFRNAEGRPAVPYPIRFRTGKGTGPAVKGADEKGAAGKGTAARADAPAGAPRVASASPDDGAMDVDPATRELRVTFDQDMNQGSFSITGGGPTFPGEPGTRPRWVDARTIVMPLKLEPNRSYQLSINSARFQGFKNTEGRPATPYPIRFRTRSGTGKGAAKKLTENDNREAIERLRTAIDEDYSYRDLREVDWDAAFASAADHLIAATTPLDFAKRAASLLDPARDMHLWLKVGDWHVPSFERKVAANMNRPSLERAIPGLDMESPIAVGRLPGGITYILIATWSAGTTLDAAYKALGEADAARGLIVDVRPNGGGNESLARQFAGCFLDETRVYSKHTTRRAGAFSAVRERSVGPNAEGPKYRGKVAVLMGPANMSSCESFLLMMKQVPGCTLVGERSFGSSGNPQPVDLGNGVTAFVPSWKDLFPDGTSLEGQGVAPDVEVKAGPDDFAAGDPVLEAAVAVLSRK